jgi:hypothetical protein
VAVFSLADVYLQMHTTDTQPLPQCKTFMA